MALSLALVAAGGCAQEADDALEGDPRGPTTTDSGDPLFAPVLNAAVAPCDPQTHLVPDHAGEACYELGSEELGAEVVDSADAELDAAGRWQVAIVLTEDGIDAFNDLAALCNPPSAACPTGQLAILLDGQVVSVPTLQQPSYERDAIVISSEFTEEEATDIASALNP